MHAPIRIDLSGLEAAWSDRAPDYPPCAVCGKPIGAEGHAGDCPVGDRFDDFDDAPCTCGADDVPLLLFRGEGEAMQSLALHWDCARPRMKG